MKWPGWIASIFEQLPRPFPLRLVDTAGLRSTDDVVERLGIEVSEGWLARAEVTREPGASAEAWLAGRYGLDPAPVAGEECEPGLLLQRGDLLADGRGGDAQVSGGGVDRARISHRHEVAERPQLDGGLGTDHVAGISVYLDSRYSAIPSCAPSRPRPEALTPPNGAAALETRPVFRPIIPVSSWSISRCARARSVV